MPNPDIESLTIKGWLMRGAIREDDVPQLFGSNPSDPYGSIFRVFRHFYDPINDKGLNVGPIQHAKAPDWGIGALDAFDNENAPNTFRRNHFTVFDAREAMFRALTGMSKTGSKAIGAEGVEPTTPADKEAVRKAYWAATFRALGDVLHLIQDLAQPQHTRHDPHAGKDYEGEPGPQGEKSFYEAYIESRATQEPMSGSDSNQVVPLPLVYDTSPSYPIPRFNNYVSYFSTQHLNASVSARKGMADYSNRGFFSVGKNLGQGDYNLPPNSISGGFYTPEQRAVGANGTTVHILKGNVSDAYANSTATEVPLTAFGAWNDALEQETGVQSFTLIRENYDAMADLLIPRAVAYSAGLIDYFFRGRMEISLPDEGVYGILDHAVEKEINDGFRKVKLKLKNTIAAIDDGQNSNVQNMTGGTLWAVVKFQRNGCYEPNLSGEPGLTSCDIKKKRGPEEVVVSDPVNIAALSAQQAQAFVFDFSTVPIPVSAVNVLLQVVYRGELGSELNAVVVATRDISEPTFVAIMNNTDYHMVDGTYYRPDVIRNTPSLMERVSGEAYLEPVDKVCSFNFGGKKIGIADIPPSTFVRFGVLADYPQFVAYVYSHTWNYWKTLNIKVNKHQYDPKVGTYEVQLIPPGIRRGVRRHFILIYLKWSGTYNDASAVNLDGLDDLDELVPRSIVIDY